jgi:type II restriction enzyme
VYVGSVLQGIIYGVLEELLAGKDIKLTSDKHLLKGKTQNRELDLVRRMLLIHYDTYSFLPDADIILYTYHEASQRVNILAIISIKNSFRERGFETTYWSVKLRMPSPSFQ